MAVPLGELGRHDGFEVTFADASFGPGRPPVITLDMLPGSDVIIAQRWNKHDGLHVWRRARLPSASVYELDDDLWNVTAENWNAYHLYGDPRSRTRPSTPPRPPTWSPSPPSPLAAGDARGGRARPGGGAAQLHPGLGDPAAPGCERARPRVGWQGGASHGVDIGEVAGPVRRFLAASAAGTCS